MAPTKTFPQVMREKMAQEGLTQSALASALGTSEANVSRWSLGKAVPSPEFYEVICRFFGIDFDQLGAHILSTEYARWKRGPL